MKSYPTLFGNLVVFASDGKLMLCDWEKSPLFPLHKAQLNSFTEDLITENKAIHLLDCYFKERITDLLPLSFKQNLAIDPIGTDFRKAIWNLLLKIPYGQTASYSDIARKMHSHPRAVANAIAHNPVSIFIPCHRVIGKNGSLTGYAGGMDAKRFLLDHEHLSEKLL